MKSTNGFNRKLDGKISTQSGFYGSLPLTSFFAKGDSGNKWQSKFWKRIVWQTLIGHFANNNKPRVMAISVRGTPDVECLMYHLRIIYIKSRLFPFTEVWLHIRTDTRTLERFQMWKHFFFFRVVCLPLTSFVSLYLMTPEHYLWGVEWSACELSVFRPAICAVIIQ